MSATSPKPKRVSKRRPDRPDRAQTLSASTDAAPEQPRGRVGDGTPGPGRPKGSKNLITRDIREMVLTALELAGDDVARRRAEAEGGKWNPTKDRGGAVTYLLEQAHANPVAFMGLIKAAMPKQIDVDVHVMTKEIAARLTQRRDHLAAQRQQVVDKVIEHRKDEV